MYNVCVHKGKVRKYHRMGIKEVRPICSITMEVRSSNHEIGGGEDLR